MAVVPGNQSQGHGVQIIDLLINDKYRLNEAELKKILLREDVKDLPVVVVSVAGAFRGGKSFLLNFFLRYLTAPEVIRNESGDWLGAEDTTLAGFSWRGGSTRHTTGILMWSEPFIATLPDGGKVAVLLMDTQGTFDSSSTVRDNSTIFALSTLISSVQIYNLKENIKEDDLQNLQFFTQYGKLLKTENEKKAFQVLEFLIRDWQYEDYHAYGQQGGEELLAEKLVVSEGMPMEVRELRQHIRSCFETVTCFLMPHPGRKVGKKTFTGKLSEIDEEFKDALRELVPSIFAPNKLTVKLINGEKVKARDLFSYFKTYMEIFNSNKVPTVSNVYTATVTAALLAAVDDARELYEARMDRIAKATQSLSSDALEDEHRRALVAAQAAFRDRKTMASKKESDAYLAQMTMELEESLPKFVLINEGKLRAAFQEAKDNYDAAIHRIHGQNLLCLHPKDLEDVHNNAAAAALTIFDSKRKLTPGVVDIERMKLSTALQEQLDSLRNTNEQHNKLTVDSVINEFSTELDALLDREPPLDSEDFTAKYEEIKATTIDTFESKRNKPTKHQDDPYKAVLLEKMSTKFVKYETMNRSKNRKLFKRALLSYKTYMRNFWDPEVCCVHPDDLKKAHQTAKTQAISIFHPSTETSDGDIFETEVLTQMLELNYYELRDQNTTLNEIAVNAAKKKYIADMDKKCEATGWWVLVVPMIVSIAKRPTFHREATEAAMNVFYTHRRRTDNPAFDPYLEQLQDKINEAYQRYR